MKQTMIERRNPLFAVIRDANHEQSMVNEDDIDFRIRGLPHSVVKQADNDRVREVVKKIENHLTDYLVNKIYNRTVYDPFSMNPKKMIQDRGNVELFGLFETDPKTQCKECFSYWSEGIVWCTCGSLERKCSEPKRHPTNIGPFLSVPDYVIKKGQLHGDRYGKASEQKEYFLSIIWKKEMHQEAFWNGSAIFSIEIIFFREGMLENNRDEDVCLKWNDLAEQDFTYRM